jgi:DNA helicase HerA-like ATPase
VGKTLYRKIEMRLPDDTQRLTVLGATGSGKTNAGLWHLAHRNYTMKPWVIYDYKCDDTICSIEGAVTLDLSDPVPTTPGIYIVHPLPDDEAEVSDHMVQIWNQENTGVFIDEALMVGKYNRGFRYLLTQGRSKHIPMIINSQRPVWVDNYVFSESDFVQVFRLQNLKDISRVQEFVPYDLTQRLPQYHSYYYDVADNKLIVMKPTPDGDAILDTFYTRLKKLKKVI